MRVHSPRKRAGVSSIPPIDADAPKVVWAIDFQFDSTVDGKAIKIASMIDEHTRESLMHVVELRLRDAELLLAPRPRRPIDPRDCSCRLESSAITSTFATTAFRSTAIWCSMLTGTVVFCLAASSSPMTGTPRLRPTIVVPQCNSQLSAGNGAC